MGNGFYRTEVGKFDLIVSVRYEADDAELKQWEAAFEQASKLLYDATDRRHQFGNIYVCKNGCSNIDNQADFFLSGDNDPTHAAGAYPALGTGGAHIELAHNDRFRPFNIVHEFGHYAYGLYDEYIKKGEFGEDPPLAVCIGIIDTIGGYKCIMEAGWTESTRFGSAGLGGSLMEGTVSEFCSQRIPEVLDANHHTHDNIQHQVNVESCWNTMVTASPTNQPPGTTFDLSLPGGADHMPEEATDRNQAAPINWIVLGQVQRFALVLDRSDSMAGAKLDNAKMGAIYWAQAAETGDHIGVVSYSDTVTVSPPLASDPDMYVITNDVDRQDVENAILPITHGGLTAIGDGLRAALEQILDDINVDATGISDKGQDVIALVTDGHHNTGEDLNDVLPDLIDNGVQAYTIGIGPSINSTLLAEIAHRTGGNYYRIDPDLTANQQAIAVKDSLIEIENIAHGGDLVTFTSGSTNPGIEGEETFIEQGSEMATFTLSWDNPQNILFLELVKPDGDTITLNSLPGNVQPIYSRGQSYMGFRVYDPEPGKWQLVVVPEQVDEKAYYRLFVFSRNRHIQGAIIAPSQVCEPKTPIKINFRCYYDHPLTGLKLRGEVKIPGGESIELAFSDAGDEESGDVFSGDGLYSTIFQGARRPGSYTIRVFVGEEEENGKVENGSVSYGKISGHPYDSNTEKRGPIPHFQRIYTRTIGVGEVPFKDVETVPNSGYPGQETFQVTLKGRGTHFEEDIVVDFGEGIDVGEVEVVNRHTAVVPIFIHKDAQLGYRNVTVSTDVYQESVYVEGGFQVVQKRRRSYLLEIIRSIMGWGRFSTLR